jgi:hypothetical protein
MYTQESITIKGAVTLYLTDLKTNTIIQTIHHKNLVVNSGKEFICRRIASDYGESPAGNTVMPVGSIAVGTNDLSLSTSNTGLSNELARSNIRPQDTEFGPNTVKFVAHISEGFGGINEAGLFSADDPAILISRTVFTLFNKTTQNGILINWSLIVN